MLTALTSFPSGRHRTSPAICAARSGPYTVKQAVDDYLSKLSDRASYRDVAARMRVHVLPKFASTPVEELTADAIRAWQVNSRVRRGDYVRPKIK